MQYMCLIYSAPDSGPTDAAAQEALMEGYFAFGTETQAAGAHIAGEPLQGVDTATTVRVRDGETLITDGPFAETKEHLGGFYLLECDDLDQALAWAAKIPTAAYGSIEVRPLLDIQHGP